MNYDDIRKLLGGYATGTLTEDERQRLMAAAMEDQRIFDALADEEALRELLDDPAFRQELLVELRETQPGLWKKVAAWWRRPLPLALAGGLATVFLAALVLVPMWQTEEPLEVAMQKTAAPESLDELQEVPASAPAPAPADEMQSTLISEREGADAALAFGERLKKKESAAPVVTVGSGGGSVAAPAPPETPAPVPMERKDVLKAQVQPKKQMAARQLGVSSEAEAYEPREVRSDVEAEEGQRPAGAVAFRSAAQSAMRDEPLREASLAVTMRVERLTGDGVWVNVESSATVSLDDTLRVEVVAPADGYAYVLTSDGGGKWKQAVGGRVSGEMPAYLPETGGLVKPDQAGERVMAVVFSENILTDSLSETLAGRDTGVAKVVVRYE